MPGEVTSGWWPHANDPQVQPIKFNEHAYVDKGQGAVRGNNK